MGRLAWSQVRFRPARALALILGVLVAATAFTVLTAASRTAQLRTVGKVSASYQPAYDILVRPAGSRTEVESETGTVQPDFLSGVYGGIIDGLVADEPAAELPTLRTEVILDTAERRRDLAGRGQLVVHEHIHR